MQVSGKYEPILKLVLYPTLDFSSALFFSERREGDEVEVDSYYICKVYIIQFRRSLTFRNQQ